ncbi:MAG: glycerol-3-phosphate acyltransferase [Chloroflexota bacterium]|nr:glycerol-3-phosphate acyltransferase [Chloroflexota bacterium]
MPWLVIITAYSLGAIPTAYIAGHLMGKDIRQLGDQNVGAANAYRELGHKIGLAVFFIDAGKGVLAVLIAHAADLSQVGVFFTGMVAVLGHEWSVFIGFKGGKGVSTTIGILLVLNTVPILILAGPTVLTLYLVKNLTPAMCVLFMALPLVSWWAGVSGALISYGIALPGLVGITDLVKNRQLAHRARHA